MAVDGADLSGAQPGDLDLDVPFVGCPRRLESDALPVGEVLSSGAQNVPDPIEGIALAAAVTADLPLDAAADIVDDGGGEREDMERVHDRAGVLELVIDGVLVPVERIQCCYPDPRSEGVAAILKPGPVGLTGAARDQVQQSRPDPQFTRAVGVVGQVDHPGQLSRAMPAVLDRLAEDVVPDMFVHAESGDVLEPGRVLGRSLQERLNRVPHRAPAAAKLTSDTVHGRVLATDLLDRPPSRPCRELRARCRDVLVLLDERPDRIAGFRAQPAALAPYDPHRPAERRRVDQAHSDPAMGMSDAPHSRQPITVGGDSTVIVKASPPSLATEATLSPGNPTSRSHRSQSPLSGQHEVGSFTSKSLRSEEVEVLVSSRASTPTRRTPAFQRVALTPRSTAKSPRWVKPLAGACCLEA